MATKKTTKKKNARRSRALSKPMRAGVAGGHGVGVGFLETGVLSQQAEFLAKVDADARPVVARLLTTAPGLLFGWSAPMSSGMGVLAISSAALLGESIGRTTGLIMAREEGQAGGAGGASEESEMADGGDISDEELDAELEAEMEAA